MKTYCIFALLLSALAWSGCSSPTVNPALWNPRPTELTVTDEIYFSYRAKLPIAGYWNRAPAGRYVFDFEEDLYLYYRSTGGDISWGSGSKPEGEHPGGLALARYDDKVFVYEELDYDKTMQKVGELPRMFVKRTEDGKMRVPLGSLPPSERAKIIMEPGEPEGMRRESSERAPGQDQLEGS